MLATPMAANTVIATIADGAPWAATAPNGQSLTLTLDPDGSGKMSRGVLSRRVSWSSKGGMICLSGLPRSDGPACLAPVAIEGGYRLTGDNGLVLSLSR
ncbi:MAG: hypothetical protein QNJ44_00585 [Rhodobacter sp.]|nr:hypothetical protein [Rhodobacter sp.]